MNPPTTVSEKQVADFLAASYGMDAEVRSVVQGVNWTFRADDSNGASYFLRLYRPVGRSRAEIDAESRALLSIQATRYLAVAKPVATTDGQYVSAASLEGGTKRNAVVFKAAHGRAIEMSTEDFELVGRALADLHAQRDAALACRDRQVLPEDIVGGTIERVARHVPSGEAVAARLSALAEPLSSLTGMVEGPLGFCHGDFRIANMSMENGRVTFFDFDDCGLGPQWLDLATIAWWLERDQDRRAAVLWQALLRGYGILTPSHTFERAICQMVIIQQFRSLRFLLDYCSLDDSLWSDTLDRAFGIIRRASTSALRIMP